MKGLRVYLLLVEKKMANKVEQNKKVIIRAVELTNEGKVKDFSSKFLQTIFDKHIDKPIKIVTDA